MKFIYHKPNGELIEIEMNVIPSFSPIDNGRCQNCGSITKHNSMKIPYVIGMFDTDLLNAGWHLGATLCSNCIARMRKQCVRCEKKTAEFRTTSRGAVCKECAEEMDLTQCVQCGAWEQQDNLWYYEHGDEHYCIPCKNSLFITCDSCNELVRTNRTVRTWGDTRVCRACAENDYTQCDSCGAYYQQDEQEAGNSYCPACERNMRNRLIHEYAYKPRPKFHPKEDWEIRMGLEGEAEVKPNTNLEEAAAKTKAAFPEGYVYLKHDGSLNNGFEIVTMPAGMSYHKATWRTFLDMKGKGLKSQRTETCGFHIHLDKSQMTKLQRVKNMLFMNNQSNVPFIEAIARRRMNNYCRVHHKTPKMINERVDRYEAYNICPRPTDELRVFKGTLTYSIFCEYVEFAQALVSFTAPAQTGIQQAKEAATFVRWLKPKRKTFPHLHRRIKELGFFN